MVNSLIDDIEDEGVCTLREAIIAANTDTASGATSGECAAGFGNDIIDLTGVSGTITLSSTLPEINSNIVINGPGATQLILDGGGTIQVLKIVGGDVTIFGLTIANGFVDQAGGSHGGGVLNSSPGTVSLESITLLNNKAVGADGTHSSYAGGVTGCCFGGGGGIFHNGPGTLNVFNSSFIANNSTGGKGGEGGHGAGGGGGGGAFGGGLFNDGGTVSVISSTFTANMVTGGNGGSGGPGGSSFHGGGGGGGQDSSLGGGGKGGHSSPTNGQNGNFGGGGGGGGGAYKNYKVGGNGGYGGGRGGNAGPTGNFGALAGGGGGGAGLGAAIFNHSGIMTITDSIFLDNQATGGEGGAGASQGENGQGLGASIFNHATITLINSTISNTAPSLSNYLPANGATDVSFYPILSWQASDDVNDPFVDSDGITFNVAFGLGPATLTESTSMVSRFVPTFPLAPLTTYYWIITATDGLSLTTSGLLSFTTEANFAPTLGNYAPTDDETQVSIYTPLDWSESDVNNDPLTTTVAFGKNPAMLLETTSIYSAVMPVPPLYLSDEPLDPLRTYYWIITTTDGLSVTTSGLLSFTTAATPTANFSATPREGIAPLTVKFDNSSAGAEWYWWDFGDGNSSSVISPTHTYAKGGVYTVSLQVYGPGGVNVISYTNYITAHNLPKPNFTGSPTVGLSPLTTIFTNTSQYADNYVWSYGDGHTSSTAAITHTHLYFSPGVYTVTLTAINNYGVVTQTRRAYVNVYPLPLSDFDANPNTGATPLNVSFSNKSTGATNYLWDFGDGSTSTVISPVHTYNSAGIYTVTLTASNPATSAVFIRSNLITVYNLSMAEFVGMPVVGPAPLTVDFTNNSQHAHLYEWNYGDNVTSTVVTGHSYTYTTPGVYTVSLKAANAYVQDVEVKPGYIIVYAPPMPTDFYVDAARGNDLSGNGTQAAPWKTLTRASSLIGGPGITIHLSAGLYNETLGEEFPIIIRPGTKIIGVDPHLVTISGNSAQPVFSFPSTVSFSDDTRVESIRIENGNVGIQVYGSSGPGSFITISNTVVTENQTGIHLYTEHSKMAHIDIEQSKITNNLGIGINLESLEKSQGVINLVNSEVKNNGSYGVRSYTYGPGSLSSFTYSTINVDNSDVSNNGADGILATGKYYGRSTVALLNSTLTNNSGYGFRVNQPEWNVEVSSNFTNSIIANNIGGGIFLSKSSNMKVSSTVINSTIADNNGFGIEFEPTNYGDIEIANSIIWGHTDNLTGIPPVHVSYSDVGDTDYVNVNENISEDPLFVNPVQNNYHVLATSPVIDAGNSAHSDLPVIDIDGDPRILGLAVDIGADEFGAILTSSGGSVNLASGITITAATDVFSDSVLVHFVLQPAVDTSPLIHANLFYDLTATYLSNGEPAQPQPEQRYSISISYRQEDIPAGVSESDLALYYWDGSSWIKEPTSNVDVEANTLTANPDHFSLWAILASAGFENKSKIFLPIVLNP